MSQLIQFGQAILDALSALMTFLVDFFADLVYFAKLVVELLPALPAFFTWIPASMWVLFSMLFGLVVVLRVLGRNE